MSLSFARENHNVKQILERMYTLLKWENILKTRLIWNNLHLLRHASENFYLEMFAVFLPVCLEILYIFKKVLCIFRQRGKERERERNWLPLMCPLLGAGRTTRDWGSDWGPFGLQAGAQSTEPPARANFLYFLKVPYKKTIAIHFLYKLYNSFHLIKYSI